MRDFLNLRSVFVYQATNLPMHAGFIAIPRAFGNFGVRRLRHQGDFVLIVSISATAFPQKDIFSFRTSHSRHYGSAKCRTVIAILEMLFAAFDLIS
jgi:hypothetical protein